MNEIQKDENWKWMEIDFVGWKWISAFEKNK